MRTHLILPEPCDVRPIAIQNNVDSAQVELLTQQGSYRLAISRSEGIDASGDRTDR